MTRNLLSMLSLGVLGCVLAGAQSGESREAAAESAGWPTVEEAQDKARPAGGEARREPRRETESRRETEPQRETQYEAPVGKLPAQLELSPGAWIAVRVNDMVSSNSSQVGDLFSATLTQPLIADGVVVARRGQMVTARVTDVVKAGKVKGTSRLGVELTELTLADGRNVNIRTQLAQYKGGTSKGNDATTIGTATGAGAAIGAIADGGFGAGVGAGAGAAAGVLGVLLTSGRQTVLYPEDTLTFRLADPVMISTERAPLAFRYARQEDYDSAQPRTPSLRRRDNRPPYFAGLGYPGWGWGPYWGPGWGPGWGGWYGAATWGRRGGWRRW